MNKTILSIILLFLIIDISYSQSTTGTLSIITIDSPSLSNNIIGDPATKNIAVYLPPSYSTTEKRYPVVYFLVGHDDNINVFLNGALQGYKVNTSMDALISVGTIKEMIFVLLDGMNLLDGSFYENSPVTGNWRDWIVKDVVSYIDSNYRTIPKREARAITGHSMGGFGAINTGMKNPETFGIVYALSPGLYDGGGLKGQGTFTEATAVKTYIKKTEAWKQMEKSAALADYRTYITSARTSGNWFLCFQYGYGAAFSPDPDANPPFTKYPYTLVNDTLKCDSTYLQNYENGFGGLAEEVVKYKDNFLSLIDFTIDYGKNDYFKWICSGCAYMSQLLTAQNIPNQLLTHNGDHSNKIKSRIEQSMLPRLSQKLEFDNSTSATEDRKTLLNDYKLYQNFPNPFNPSTVITYRLPEQNNVTLRIYDTLGQEIKTLVESFQSAGEYSTVWNGCDNSNNLVSSGIYFYKLETENYNQYKKMVLMK